MKNLIKITFVIISLLLNSACEKAKRCPEGMQEMKLDNGTTICVPDHLAEK